MTFQVRGRAAARDALRAREQAGRDLAWPGSPAARPIARVLQGPGRRRARRRRGPLRDGRWRAASMCATAGLGFKTGLPRSFDRGHDSCVWAARDAVGDLVLACAVEPSTGGGARAGRRAVCHLPRAGDAKEAALRARETRRARALAAVRALMRVGRRLHRRRRGGGARLRLPELERGRAAKSPFRSACRIGNRTWGGPEVHVVGLVAAGPRRRLSRRPRDALRALEQAATWLLRRAKRAWPGSSCCWRPRSPRAPRWWKTGPARCASRFAPARASRRVASRGLRTPARGRRRRAARFSSRSPLTLRADGH